MTTEIDEVPGDDPDFEIEDVDPDGEHEDVDLSETAGDYFSELYGSQGDENGST